MPDRELSDQVRQQLSAALEGGAPLVSPLPAQARFAGAVARMPVPRWRVRALTVAAAVAGIVAVALAGPQQPRQWIVQSVGDIAHGVSAPAGTASPSPSSHAAPAVRESPGATRSPVTRETPEANESPEANQSPQPTQSPEHEQPQPSPTASPSGGDGDGDDGGGDHSSPQPSPSPGD